jgi:threonyl-tRNA synthetase
LGEGAFEKWVPTCLYSSRGAGRIVEDLRAFGLLQGDMYLFEKNRESYVVKPTNCPFHVQIYKSKPRSYKDLPIRYAEWRTVYRHERSGTLHGLLRVRGFTQDDAYIFCGSEQVAGEVAKLLDLAKDILRRFGFRDFKAHLSTRDLGQPEKYMGSED